MVRTLLDYGAIHMKSSYLLFALLIAVLPSSSTATPSRSWSTFEGAGGASCGKWIEARAHQEGDSQVYSQWVVGFLAGVTWASEVDLVGGTDISGRDAWLDSYCGAHPLDSISTAAESLANELHHRK